MPSVQQGRYWLLTIAEDSYAFPSDYELPSGVVYVRGQLERGEETGFVHWQVLVVLEKKKSLSYVRNLFGGTAHVELTRSKAAEDYVWKEATRIGEPFEFGIKPFNRSSRKDWDRILRLAKSGNMEEIPADVLVHCWSNLQKISAHFAEPVAVERQVVVYFGRTGTGKSRRAWSEAGLDAYPKDPRSKFWDGYRGQEGVVLDEFRGGIDIAHFLRWTDRYPVIVDVKGSSTVLKAKKIWITSNLHPRLWYPTLDDETLAALLRRLYIVEFPFSINIDT